MKIQVKIDVFDDEFSCNDSEIACPHRNDGPYCHGFPGEKIRVRLAAFSMKWKKHDQCKEAYQKAKGE